MKERSFVLRLTVDGRRQSLRRSPSAVSGPLGQEDVHRRIFPLRSGVGLPRGQKRRNNTLPSPLMAGWDSHPDWVLMVPSSGKRGDHVYMGMPSSSPVVDVVFGHEQIHVVGIASHGAVRSQHHQFVVRGDARAATVRAGIEGFVQGRSGIKGGVVTGAFWTRRTALFRVLVHVPKVPSRQTFRVKKQQPAVRRDHGQVLVFPLADFRKGHRGGGDRRVRDTAARTSARA